MVKPFNLESLPLMRVRILHTENRKNILFFDIHHIIFDGASLAPFFRDLSRAYNGLSLEKDRMQYINYGKWLETLDMSKEKDYWYNKFENFPELLELPTDYLRTMERNNVGKEVKSFLDRQFLEKITEVNDYLGTTDYMIPTYYQQVDKFKRNDSDKVNIERLPEAMLRL